MKKYRDIGLKLTPQRLAILNYLEGNEEHPSAETIYKEVSKNFPTMSYATVYNTLEALKRQGIVAELAIDPGKKRFDPNMVPHHHLMCLTCKRIVDIQRDFAVTLNEGDSANFEILGNHIEFYGFCPRCKKRRSAVHN